MASIGRRIEALEGLVQPPASPKDKGAALRRTLMRNILDEFARLKASRAVGYRAGKRIEPENIPRRILGAGYTKGQLWELAVRRVVLEREHKTAPDILSADTVEDLVETWTRFFREMLESQGGDWSEVEDDVA
ncbi:MAG TPA: hypothetical protein VKA82_12270 [Rubrobacter sp.]|nr:hypothetical protein [Rubrobacter sp.]